MGLCYNDLVVFFSISVCFYKIANLSNNYEDSLTSTKRGSQSKNPDWTMTRESFTYLGSSFQLSDKT